MPQGKRKHCHSIRVGFKFSNYTLGNNEKKTSILIKIIGEDFYTFRVIEKGFQCLYNFVEPEKQLCFFMSFADHHRPYFAAFLVKITRKFKLQVGSVGRQLVLEGSLFNNDILLESYFLFEVILHWKHLFFVKEKIQNFAIYLQTSLCCRNLSF